jgi:phosphoribosylpyrophosphate synthetase
MHDTAEALVQHDPSRFEYFVTKWKKFPDGTDNITVGGYEPENRIQDRNVVFLASFDSNETFLSQLHVLIMLSESFVNKLIIVLPFLPTATMDRQLQPGRIATANTTSKLLSCLPPVGAQRTRVMLYDNHTLQNQFFFGGNCAASLHTGVDLVIQRIGAMSPLDCIDCIAFPDDGAEKRFSRLFKTKLPGSEVVVCGKHRTSGDGRKVVIQSGNPQGKNVLIIDDLIQTGGTMYECAVQLKAEGAKSVNAYVTHAVFPKESWRRFLADGDRAVFTRFWVTSSNPVVSKVIAQEHGSVFEVLDLAPQIAKDL